MLYKLLSLIGLGAPSVVVLPPVIYSASSSINWEENWVVRIEDNNEVLICDKSGQDDIGYRILVEANTGERGKVELRAEHIPGFKQRAYGIRLRFQGVDENFMISDENEEDQGAHGGGGVYCSSSKKWNAEGVKIDGKPVKETQSSKNSWGGDLSYLSGYIKQIDASECSVYFMQVVCKLKWEEHSSGIESKKSGAEVDNGTLIFSGSLPNLVYRPF